MWNKRTDIDDINVKEDLETEKHKLYTNRIMIVLAAIVISSFLILCYYKN